MVLLLTYFFAFTCFPSIIVYKRLPGDIFKTGKVSDIDDYQETIAWMGVINIGLFLICYAIGILVANKKFRPNESNTQSWSSRPLLLILLIFTEFLCAGFIYW